MKTKRLRVIFDRSVFDRCPCVTNAKIMVGDVAIDGINDIKLIAHVDDIIKLELNVVDFDFEFREAK